MRLFKMSVIAVLFCAAFYAQVCFADEQAPATEYKRTSSIQNGGTFVLAMGETAVFEFINFKNKQFSLSAINNDIVTLNQPQGRNIFCKTEPCEETKDTSHPDLIIKVGEQAICHEEQNMSIILKLERIGENGAVFSIMYGSIPPEPEISPSEKIKILYK